MSVDQYNIIQTSELTHRRTHDVAALDSLMEPLPDNVNQVTADTAYDSNNIYTDLSKTFPNVDIVIPPRSNAIDHKNNHWMRNRNLREIQCYGWMHWQSSRRYGNRNQAERAIGRYKRILGNRLHARDFKRQQQEILMDCSILNKMNYLSLAPVRQKS